LSDIPQVPKNILLMVAALDGWGNR
jgi:hypothetical protein